MSIVWFDSIDSTNAYVKQCVKNGQEMPFCVASETQTTGRGRLGRSFISPKGGLYISFILDYDPEIVVTAKCAVAVKRAIEKVSGIKCRIKWVNDLYYNGKKVCGILAEAVENKVVLGIGINWYSDTGLLPEEAGGLGQTEDSLKELANVLYNEIYSDNTEWLDEYRNSDMLAGKDVNVIKADKVVGHGIVSGIDSSCRLHIVEENGNEMVLSSGEVSIRYR